MSEIEDAAARPAKRRFALIVSLDLVEGAAAEFRPAIEANASDSLRLEPGCLRFDVLLPSDDDPPQVVLYEIYTDRAAFDLHLAMPHYLAFERLAQRTVRQKRVRFFAIAETGATMACGE